VVGHSSELSGRFSSTLDGTVVVIDSAGLIPWAYMRQRQESPGRDVDEELLQSVRGRLEAQMHGSTRSGWMSCARSTGTTTSHCTSRCSDAGDGRGARAAPCGGPPARASCRPSGADGSICFRARHLGSCSNVVGGDGTERHKPDPQPLSSRPREPRREASRMRLRGRLAFDVQAAKPTA